MAIALAEKPAAEVLPEHSGAYSLFNGHYCPPPADKDGKTWVRTSVLIQAEPNVLYQMWRDVESAPAWHERIVEASSTGPTTYHWVMKNGSDDETLEWEFEIMADTPGKHIAWRSLSGDPQSAGEVLFEHAPGGRGTMVTLLEEFHIGKLARAWKAITGRDPKQSAIENLRHFKALAETGEIPRIEPQPQGDRGAIGGMKQSAYGEKIPAPPGVSATSKNATGTEGSLA